MRTWLRVTLPSLGMLPVFVVLIGASAAFRLSLWALVGQALPELDRPGKVTLGWAVAIYAMSRVGFHPIVRPQYHVWLASTPWVPSKPLPLGPVHLVMQDIAFVCFAMLVGWPACGEFVWFMPQLFLAVYIAALSIVLAVTGEAWFAYALAFGVGLIVYFWRSVPFALGAAALTYLLAYFALRQSLARFPWDLERLESLRQSSSYRGRAAGKLGWPFDSLAPKSPNTHTEVPLKHAVATGLLAGWGFYVVASLFPPSADRSIFCATLPLYVAFFASLVRLVRYIGQGYLPPISLAGRLLTGRWIIRGYDQVFAAPLLATFMAVSLTFVGWFLRVDPTISGPIVVAVILMIAIGMGPSLREWRLTGNHRIIPVRSGDSVQVG